MGTLCATAAALLALVSPQAGDALRARCQAPPPPPPPPVHVARPPRRDTLLGALRHLHLTHQISWHERLGDERLIRRAQHRGGQGVSDMLALADGLAARRALPVGRTRAIFATIDHNLRARPGAPLQRRKAGGLVWQDRPPYGWQVHPLATAGRLNALVTARHRGGAARVADALIARGTKSGAALDFEYLFPFGIGRPPWISAMAQSTAAQALARTYRLTHRRRYLVAARAAYQGMLQAAVHAPDGSVQRFVMYSFAPGDRILNGELQMLVGLHDYARIARDRPAMRMFVRLAGAELDAVGQYDTGAWTLYEQGGVEATVHYHALATRFAGELCHDGEQPFCPVHDRFARYLREPAALTLKVGRTGRARRSMGFFVAASKPATATVAVVRIDGLVAFQERVSLGRGGLSLTFTPPKRGHYTVALWATALNGKRSTMGEKVVVAAPPRRHRHHHSSKAATAAPSGSHRRAGSSRR